MSKTKKHKKNWETLGKLDPFWAILSDNSKRFNKWELDEFLRTGEIEVKNIMTQIEKNNIFLERGEMLDFGCGLGRLARSFLKYFSQYNGSDISQAMVEQARELNAGLPAKFFVNDDNLEIFADKSFAFIYSGIVLQHLPNREFIKKYILEFRRVLKDDGVLVFQLPSKIPWRFRFQPIRRLYNILKKLSFSEKFLYQKLRLYPIKMNFIKEAEMISFLSEAGFVVKDVQADTYCGPQVESRTYYCLAK